jgi:hypothetical protein
LAGAASAGAAVPRRIPAPRRSCRGGDAARSRPLAALTAAVAGSGRAACRPAFFVRLGAKRCWARALPSAAPGRRPPCWRCAIGCARATSLGGRPTAVLSGPDHPLCG